MRLSRLLPGLVLLAWLTTGWCDSPGTGETVGAKPASADRVPRLRFKSGPVCLCSGGLSEADIRRAEQERGMASPEEIKPKMKSDREEE